MIPKKFFSRITSRGMLVVPGTFLRSQGLLGVPRGQEVGRGLGTSGGSPGSLGVPGIPRIAGWIPLFHHNCQNVNKCFWCALKNEIDLYDIFRTWPRVKVKNVTFAKFLVTDSCRDGWNVRNCWVSQVEAFKFKEQ